MLSMLILYLDYHCINVTASATSRPTKLARSGTPRTHATAYLLYNYPKVGNFIRDFQSSKNKNIQNFDEN